MQTRRSSSALAVSDEVPLSFQDELAATIHRAFEVAVQLAVVEVSKLVSQALGDVRDQMQETLQENTVLKTRLQSAERGGLVRIGKRRRGKGSASLDEDHCHSDLPPAKTESQPAATPKAEPSAQESLESGTVSQYEERPEKQDESFCEIREDGIVQSRELDLFASTPYKIKSDKQQMPPHCQDAQSDTNDSSMLLKDQLICKKEEIPEPVLIALEEINDDDLDNTIRPGCCFNSEPSQVIETDRLSVVQSKLLEDWRPDPDELHSHKNKPVDAGHCQRLDGHPGISISFDGLFQSAEGTDVHATSQTEDVEMRKNLHTRIHQCKICGHSFSRASDLRRHHSHRHRVRASNTGRAAEATKANKQQLFPPGCSPYHCNECGRDFNRMENLKTHLRIHTGERPYSCSVCGVRFRHSGALTRHFRIHTGEKPYVCGQCGKRFRNCGGLRFHQKSHTRDRHLGINCT